MVAPRARQHLINVFIHSAKSETVVEEEFVLLCCCCCCCWSMEAMAQRERDLIVFSGLHCTVHVESQRRLARRCKSNVKEEEEEEKVREVYDGVSSSESRGERGAH